jgi:formate--tetrahydrofolate ligase
MRPITEVAEQWGLKAEEIELYGSYKAKITLDALERRLEAPDGKLVLVTAMTPTKFGEGKTTVAIGLAQGLNRLDKRTVVCLREPSLGPCLGLKGGATGGGKSEVLPSEDINLHFTGDIHAVTSAHNALAAILDNHLHFGNGRNIDFRSITWKRVMDMNERSLRHIVLGLGGREGGIPRESSFEITAASEVMAILSLSKSYSDLKERLGRICVAFDGAKQPVFAEDLKATGAMSALLRDALKPNLVQTSEGTPALIHGGPFANIAHGCNSILATRLGLKLGEIVITEAGFGADLGAEKFVDIKCRTGGLTPNAVVIVATLRALKWHGGAAEASIGEEDRPALEKGLPNLVRHCRNMVSLGLLPVVAINLRQGDKQEEVEFLVEKLGKLSIPAAPCDVWTQGGAGAAQLGQLLLKTMETGANNFHFLYDEKETPQAKIESIASQIYGAGKVVYTKDAERNLDRLSDLGMTEVPVCVSKTQYSFTDDPGVLGAPEGFEITVREVKPSWGAGFLVAYTGNLLTMPGLPRVPAAERISLTGEGVIEGVH